MDILECVPPDEDHTEASENAADDVSPVPSAGTLVSARNQKFDNVMTEICQNNGIPLKPVKGTRDVFHADCLEMFFSGYPRMVYLRYFPRLTKLCIIEQVIPVIEGLDTLPMLQELWICETRIQRIDGLEKNLMLRRLYLYGNKIRKIENLRHLKRLEVLWVSSNCISTLQGLSELKSLRELNVAENYIKLIGHNLDGLNKLEILNLSSNRISSYKELYHLSRLPALKNLSLWDVTYAPNPVCLMCNYMMFVLFYMPLLNKLDGQDVSIKENVMSSVAKKKMYYSMRKKVLEKEESEEVEQIEQRKKSLLCKPLERLRDLCIVSSEIEKLLTDNPVPELESEDVDLYVMHGKLLAKKKALIDRAKYWEAKMQMISQVADKWTTQVHEKTEIEVMKLSIELQAGGNITFHEGSSSDPWYKLIEDMVQSRFCAAEYKDFGITGVGVNRIVHVHNQQLRMQFDHHLYSLVDQEEQLSITCDTGGNLVEYLLYIWDSAFPSDQIFRVIEDGFASAEVYQKLGQDPGVPMSNSLYLAERRRLTHLGFPNSDRQHMIDKLVLLCKVVVGANVAKHQGKSFSRQDYSRFDSIYRIRNYVREHVPEDYSQSALGSSRQRNTSSVCQCSGKQIEWCIFDNERVLPEYLIELEYITPENPDPEKRMTSLEQAINSASSDEDIINIEPPVQLPPPIVGITESVLRQNSDSVDFMNIRVLNLHAMGLKHLHGVELLYCLNILVVTFNELTGLSEVANMASIQDINASFNKIGSLDGMKGMTGLRFLDVSYNNIEDTRMMVALLRKNAPSIEKLTCKYNSGGEMFGDLRLRIIARLKTLLFLDGKFITEMERKNAMRRASTSRVSYALIQEYGRIEASRPPCLTLQNNAQLLLSFSKNKPVIENFNKVTSLCLDNVGLGKLSNLEPLVSLKYASFAHNMIAKIESLENCSNIEELSLEHNCIPKIEGISHLQKLHLLHLGHNEILTLKDIAWEKLHFLSQLSVEHNRITSLAGLENKTSLTELYAFGNSITKLRDIVFLKKLSRLWVLDLSANQISESLEIYRLHVIFHLPSLRVLDGEPVGAQEEEAAKDNLGGRLTIDVITHQLGTISPHEVTQLDLVNLSIRQIDLDAAAKLNNLRSLNLENNNLSSLAGLECLPHLNVLCVNNNRVASLAGRQSGMNLSESVQKRPVFRCLQVLLLAYNGIANLETLSLGCAPHLQTLFLQGNEISQVEGLEELSHLRELVLDRNRIKHITDSSFQHQRVLVELHLEENRFKDLGPLGHITSLQRLYLGMNRIQELSELQKLEQLHNLKDLSLIGNPVARKQNHRPSLVYRMPQLLIIDGIEITLDERSKAEMFFMDQQPSLQSSLGSADVALPGIAANLKMPVKMSTVRVANITDQQQSVFTEDPSQITTDAVQIEGATGKTTLPYNQTYKQQRP